MTEIEETPEKRFENSFTVIFLMEKNPVRIVMFRRAEWKKMAPNYYTGIGGKVEKETALENAYRELEEETGITGVELREFARCLIYEKSTAVYYFWGIYPGGELPDCNEGVLEWSGEDDLGDLTIVPSTLLVIEEWKKRKFEVDSPWTVIAKPLDDPSVYMGRELVRVIEGLY